MFLNNGMGKKLQYIPTKEQDMAVKRNTLPIHTTRWIDLKSVLHQRSQTQKSTYSVISFT